MADRVERRNLKLFGHNIKKPKERSRSEGPEEWDNMESFEHLTRERRVKCIG